jgi:carbamoyltransferase
MYVMGLSALEHDSAAALVSDRGIVAAIEESKLTRTPAKGGIPYLAIQFCLDRAGIEGRDVRTLAVASRPLPAWVRPAALQSRRFDRHTAGALTRGLDDLIDNLRSFRPSEAVNQDPAARVLPLEHHLCHGASAFFASSFDRAVILTLDERGHSCCGMAALGEGTNIRPLRSIAFPNSVGWLYSQITALLGFEPHLEEHKTQWLSLEGEPSLTVLFQDVLGQPNRGLPQIDLSYLNSDLTGVSAFSAKFYRRLGLESEKSFRLTDGLSREIAASFQQACARLLAQCVEQLCDETGVQNVCLAGGLFVNALLVAAIEKVIGLERVFAQPAAGNAGSALGSAWLAWHQILAQPRSHPICSLDWGPSYGTEDIKYVLDNCKARYRWFDTEAQRIEATVQALEQAEIVAWHQGATEFGPRALGHRSILASPWAPYIKENLNHYVKHREPFRPFAIAVPEEDCSRYFECSRLIRFMASLGSVRPEARNLVKDFVLPGDRIRLCAVDRHNNPFLWQLLKEWGKRFPAPFLINTSFNLFGEPLVVTPRDAVRSFFCSGIDAMLIDGFFVTKS